jgi:hypothetical protein
MTLLPLFLATLLLTLRGLPRNNPSVPVKNDEALVVLLMHKPL